MKRRRKPSYVEPRQIVTIVLLAACLVAVLVLKSRCGAAVGNLFHAVDSRGDLPVPPRSAPPSEPPPTTRSPRDKAP